MSVVESLVALCAPYAKFYNHSKVLSVGATYLHLAAMLGAGGLAIGADRRALTIDAGDTDAVRRHVAENGALHRWVVSGLAVSAVSGAMMFAADVETFATSWLYASKLASVFLLALNGAMMLRAEGALRADPADARAVSRLRAASAVSLVLWFTVALLGTIVKTEA